MEDQSDRLLYQMLHLAVENLVPADHWNVKHLLTLLPPVPEVPPPTVSVAVCTRDRTEDLALCLTALGKLDHAPLEILVIDNAPRTNATRDLVETSFPEVRYILEPRPGLDHARNRAIAEARGEVLAYTDDDVIVDARWTWSIVTLFGSDSDIMAITGLVVPYELETEPQQLFEQYGGFGRGFVRKWYRADKAERRHLARQHAGSGKYGTGANMAYRRAVFPEIGVFDPALDVGTVTNGGGDLDMFFRVLKYGHTLVYEPAAIVRHRHRRDYAHLRTQITNNGIGFFSHLVRNSLEFPEERKGLAGLGLWWFWEWNLRRGLRSLFKPGDIPRELVFAELRGSFTGLFRYGNARANAKVWSAEYETEVDMIERMPNRKLPVESPDHGVAVRRVEVTDPAGPIVDVTDYFATRVYVTRHGRAVGVVNIINRYRAISAVRAADEIVQAIGLELLRPVGAESFVATWVEAMTEIKQSIDGRESCGTEQLPLRFSASIVVATFDRPDSLRECLGSLCRQKTSRSFEIVVVDNRPQSGKTPPVVAEFSGIRLVSEPRGGLSYARNTGFAASTGDIFVCTDDDVIAPQDWLENLLAPFSRNDVMLVTGNVLPAELESPSQVEFENYGGLGKGFQRREFNRKWFNSFRRKAVPTWTIGATANAAVRATILQDPAVGLLDEALGAGTPAGCSEDTYLFYKILKAGHTIIYEPTAFVWHKHRANDQALHKQIYSYSTGHSAYNLTTFLRDRDGRGLVRIWVEIPSYQIKQLLHWLRGSRGRSLRTILLEIRGNAFGPISLWKSRRRVKRLGAGPPHLPAEPQLTPQPASVGGPEWCADEDERLTRRVEATKTLTVSNQNLKAANDH
jgi:GT2 family glycosyltransferase